MVGLFPRVEHNDLPWYDCNQGNDVNKFSGYEKCGFSFCPMTSLECAKSFSKDSNNPYIQFNKNSNEVNNVANIINH